ncbi:unnamed protein product, partial [Closterium sp. NIES-65]
SGNVIHLSASPTPFSPLVGLETSRISQLLKSLILSALPSSSPTLPSSSSLSPHSPALPSSPRAPLISSLSPALPSSSPLPPQLPRFPLIPPLFPSSLPRSPSLPALPPPPPLSPSPLISLRSCHFPPFSLQPTSPPFHVTACALLFSSFTRTLISPCLTPSPSLPILLRSPAFRLTPHPLPLPYLNFPPGDASSSPHPSSSPPLPIHPSTPSPLLPPPPQFPSSLTAPLHFPQPSTQVGEFCCLCDTLSACLHRSIFCECGC